MKYGGKVWRYLIDEKSESDWWCIGASEERLLPGSVYLFLTLGNEPRTSEAFIAIVGPHALALSQEDGLPFQAVRMTKSSALAPTLGPHNGWDLVYSTPDNSLPLGRDNLRTELCGFLDRVNRQGNIPDPWNRGYKVESCLQESRTWTIFDCGTIGHT